VIDEEPCRRVEARKIQLLVQLRGGEGMNRLQPDRDFERSSQLSREGDTPRADSTGVRLDGDSPESLQQLRQPREVVFGYRSDIEEITGVVQLDAMWQGRFERL